MSLEHPGDAELMVTSVLRCALVHKLQARFAGGEPPHEGRGFPQAQP